MYIDLMSVHNLIFCIKVPRFNLWYWVLAWSVLCHVFFKKNQFFSKLTSCIIQISHTYMACNEIQVFINSFVVICVWVGMSDTWGFQWWEATVGCTVINKLCINLCTGTLYIVNVWCTNVCLWWLIQCMCKVYQLDRYFI